MIMKVDKQGYGRRQSEILILNNGVKFQA